MEAAGRGCAMAAGGGKMAAGVCEVAACGGKTGGGADGTTCSLAPSFSNSLCM